MSRTLIRTKYCQTNDVFKVRSPKAKGPISTHHGYPLKFSWYLLVKKKWEIIIDTLDCGRGQ